MRDWASELRAIADGRLMLHVRNGVTVSRSMLAMIADELDAERAAHAETRRELLEMEKSQMRQASACGMATSRAEAAEAQRDEALKAQNYLKDAVLCGLSDQEIARRARLLVEASRRVREGGNADD